MRKALVVDAGCDLSEATRKAFGIEMWPIEVVHPDGNFVDTRDEGAMLAMYQRGTDHLLAASTQPLDIGRARAKLMEFTTRQDELLYLSIMTKRSPAMAQAKLAADSLPLSLRTERKLRDMNQFRFQVADSAQLFAGYALVAVAAQSFLQQRPLEDCARLIAEFGNSVSGYLIPGELRTIRERAMKKGEESVSLLGYALGTALDIKPLIAARQGKTAAVTKIRGFEHAINSLVDAVIQQIKGGIVTFPAITLVYGGALTELEAMPAVRKLREAASAHDIAIYTSMMSMTGVINVGPGGFSLALASKLPPLGDFSLLK